MPSKIICISFLLLFPSLFKAQVTEELHVADFNYDGAVDTIHIFSEYGRALELTFKDGESGTSYEFWLRNEKSNFIELVPIPNALLSEGNKPLLDTIQNLLIGTIWFNKKEVPALGWLRNAYAHAEADTSTHFKRFFVVEPKWYNGVPEFPEIIAKRVNRMEYPLHPYYWRDSIYTEGWLVYLGHNHNTLFSDVPKQFEPLSTYGESELLSTRHGLIISRDMQYAWIFHTDGLLTGGPDKLRWSSINKAVIDGQYVFLHHISTPTNVNRFFMIDIGSGVVGELKLPRDFDWNSPTCYTFSSTGGKLIIEPQSGSSCDWIEEQPEALEFDILTLAQELLEHR